MDRSTFLHASEMLLPSTDLVRVCRQSGLSESEIQSLVSKLQTRHPRPVFDAVEEQRPAPAPRTSGALTRALSLLTTIQGPLR